jgi:imidazoleglycerol-phosphate dehydratase/histidinol-phosphatase
MRKALVVDIDVIFTDQSVIRLDDFKAGVIINLFRIVRQLEYELVLLVPRDYPEDAFLRQVLNLLQSQGIPVAYRIAGSELSSRLKIFSDGIYDLKHSVLLTFDTDVMKEASNFDMQIPKLDFQDVHLWDSIFALLKTIARSAVHSRKTGETRVEIELNLDGEGKAGMSTGLGFFDHMLDQIARHGGIDLSVRVQGDLHIDEHHTIEDTGLALGEAFSKALGKKTGLERYGFFLPMDESVCRVALDFSGRSYLVWKVRFKRERVGEVPTELFEHFFKSFCDTAKCNLFVEVEGKNDHHKIEAVFKAFARAIKMALRKDPDGIVIPSTKGTL